MTPQWWDPDRKPCTHQELIDRLVAASRCPHCDATHEIVTPANSVFNVGVRTTHQDDCPFKRAIRQGNVHAQRHLYLAEVERAQRQVYQWMTLNAIDPEEDA